MRTDRRARRKRRLRPRHAPKKTDNQIIDEIADPRGVEGGFDTTYRPPQYEGGWLLQSLRAFFDQAIITDVLALVKGGKEANVYRCQAHPSTRERFLAAKVYRPRMLRTLRNDARCRQGRIALTEDGTAARQTDQRIMRALGKKTAFGRQVAHTSWLMHEYQTLQWLYAQGGAAPQPFAARENAILMEYLGDEQVAAPTLNTVALEPGEAQTLFREVLRNIELLLTGHKIHGDLSAYNILYWQGYITLIDFPQVVDAYANSDARFIFQRDIVRVCEYFAGQGAKCDAAAIGDELWSRHVACGF